MQKAVMQATLAFKDAAQGTALELTLLPDKPTVYRARLTMASAQATAEVYAFQSNSLPRLLAELAEHWQGWQRAETWSSVEGELHLEFRHDPAGQMRVDVRLRRYLPEEWEMHTVLNLDPATLPALAREAEAFFRNFGEQKWT
jgi:uncharacterized protein DUF6228